MKVFGGKDYEANITYFIYREEPVKALDSATVDPSGTKEVSIEVPNGYSAVAVTVKAAYHESASTGVRIRWLYSPDGTSYDSPEDAEAQGNFEDMTFEAGKERQRTVLIPAVTSYIKVQVINRDSSYPATVTLWYLRLR